MVRPQAAVIQIEEDMIRFHTFLFLIIFSLFACTENDKLKLNPTEDKAGEKMSKEEKMAFTIKIAEETIEKGEMPIAACIFLHDDLISKAYTTEKTEKRLDVILEEIRKIKEEAVSYTLEKLS